MMTPLSSSLISVTRCESCLGGSAFVPVPSQHLLYGAEHGVHLRHSKNISNGQIDFLKLKSALLDFLSAEMDFSLAPLLSSATVMWISQNRN